MEQHVSKNKTIGAPDSMKGGIIKFTAAAICIALGTSMALAWGEHTTIRIIQTQTMLIRHKATELQRRVAENNAQIFFKQLSPATREELKKKKIKTVLIRTVRSKETSPAAKDVRMRYSVEGESLIDDYAYEFQNPLQAGTLAKTATVDAEYVGM
jgi:hypothetical protein